MPSISDKDFPVRRHFYGASVARVERNIYTAELERFGVVLVTAKMGFAEPVDYSLIEKGTNRTELRCCLFKISWMYVKNARCEDKYCNILLEQHRRLWDVIHDLYFFRNLLKRWCPQYKREDDFWMPVYRYCASLACHRHSCPFKTNQIRFTNGMESGLTGADECSFNTDECEKHDISRVTVMHM